MHRDVKPDNVFILEDGSVKLLDFGIAKLTTSSNLTRQGDVLGSASYMSPEQVSGSDSVDGRADLFSTGVMLYELLTGHKPFEADAPTAVILKILKDDPTPIEKWTPGSAAAAGGGGDEGAGETSGRPLGDGSGAGPRVAGHPPRCARVEVDCGAGRNAIRQHADDEVAARRPAEAARPGEDWRHRCRRRRGRGQCPRRGRPRTPVGRQPDARAGHPRSGSGARCWRLLHVRPPGCASGATGGQRRRHTRRLADVHTTGNAATTTPAATPASAPEAPAAPKTADVVPATAPRPVSAPLVPVSIAGGYPFEILDAGKVVSPAKESHELKLPAGRSLRDQRPDIFSAPDRAGRGSAPSPGFD